MSSNGLLPATERMLLRRVAAEQANGRTPSLVAAFVRDGRMVWSGSRGRVGSARPDAATQYRIGSITKTFTAVLVMRLRDEGRLGLDDRLDVHVPGTPVGDRTVAQLLAHLGGVAAETPDPWWERTPGAERGVADALGSAPAKHPPGRRYHYSNVAFALLGELVARLRGSTWAQALDAEILRPLEMSRTTQLPAGPHAAGWAVHPWADVVLPEPAHDAGVMAPAGQLWSTAADLARWVAFLGGDTGSVLSADTLAEMREPVVVEDEDDGFDGWRSAAGLGLQLWRVDGRCLSGHLGSMPGFLAAAWVDPAGGAGALALANATAGPAVGELAADLIDIVAGQEPRLTPEWEPAAAPDPGTPGISGMSDITGLLELAGVWYWGPAPFALTLAPEGGLLLSALRRSRRESRFRPEPDGTWTGLDGYFAGETLSVHRRGDGTVGHVNIASFVFTRTPYDPDAPVPGGVDPAGWRPGPPRPDDAEDV
jgi:CubicO group peptidase (beta-lactamase class C family)